MQGEDSWTVALYGAAGALGEQVLIGLEGEGLEIGQLIPVGAARSAGRAVRWRGADVGVVTRPEVPVNDIDVALLALPPDIAGLVKPELIGAGALVVDLSGARYPTSPLPLVWPGLGGIAEALSDHPGGFALPCAAASTCAPIVAAIIAAGAQPTLVDAIAIESAASAGSAGQQALSAQTIGLLNQRVVDRGPFDQVLAFNVLDGSADAAGQATEARFVREMATLVSPLDARVTLSRLIAPMFAGHGVALTIRFEDGQTPSHERLVAALEAHDDVELVDEAVGVRQVIDEDRVRCGPPRVDEDGVLRMFCVADPLHRIGSAVGTLLSVVIQRDLW